MMMDFESELIEIYPWIQGLSHKFCYSEADAEDLASETVFKLLLNKDKFDLTKDLKPWCLAVMQNTYITMYNRKASVTFVDIENIIEPESYFDVFECTSFKRLLSIIRHYTKKSCCIECVILRARGYSYDEISRILCLPVSTVRSRISFGRIILRRILF